MKSKVVLVGLLAIALSSFTSWYPFLITAMMFGKIYYIALVFAVSSIISMVLSLVIYLYKWSIMILYVALTTALFITYIICTIFGHSYLWLVVLALLLAISGYFGRAYNVLVKSSARIPGPLKPKILEEVMGKSWVYGFLGCLLLTLLASAIHVIVFLGLLVILTSIILLVPVIMFKPFSSIGGSNKNVVYGGFKFYSLLVVYSVIVVFALNTYYPFLPVYVSNILGVGLIGVGLFYASITVLSRAMLSLAQLIIAVKDPATAFLVRSLVSGLLLLTASTSENPWFTLISLTIVLSLSPLHTLAYSVFARGMGVKLTVKAEILYTITGILAVFFGYTLWSKSPVFIIAVPAFILLFSAVFIGYLRKLKVSILREES